ncbi:hypothetical protein HMPREF0673_00634 [Leyella stercorea DSM 18206]|uniref:Uncharacterized protein n=1 Tax=Leyella stercorea DSM 18206 TaxID=1002367 RepID=G6AVJ9_9BACT|nr:hypothetical protein HMPREF0673_00634 [Leyella stercorea DSM 18206]
MVVKRQNLIFDIQYIKTEQVYNHLALSFFRTYAIRVGRCGRLRRSMRMSASVDADVCAGRCGCYTHNK